MFRRLPRIDQVFVPGRRPGTHAAEVHDGAARKADARTCTDIIRKREMWMSPQGFTKDWMNEYFDIMKTQPTLALRGCLRSAADVQPCRASRTAAETLSDSLVSRHHAQRPLAVSGERLGPRLRAHGRPRNDQSAPGRRDQRSSADSALHNRLRFVFGRLQRRRQQIPVERAWLESRSRSARDST